MGAHASAAERSGCNAARGRGHFGGCAAGRYAGRRAGRGAGRGGDDNRTGTPARSFEAREIVGANHAPARGHRERLHHARKFDSGKLGTKGAAQVHPPYRRDRKPGRRERGTGQILASGGAGRGRDVVREPQGGGGAVRDLDGGVVGGDHGRDGPVAMRGENVLDDCSGIREIDPDSTIEPGDERVLALARDNHVEAQIASRFQIGVYPVAAGWGDQENPGGVVHSTGTRPRPRQAPGRFLRAIEARRRPRRDPGRLPHSIGTRWRPRQVLVRFLRPTEAGRRPQAQPPPPPPAAPHAPQVPAPPVAWNTLLNTKVEPVSRVT